MPLRRLALMCVPVLLSSGCALKTIAVNEAELMKGRPAPQISDEIRRVNLAIDLPDEPGQQLRGWRLAHPAPRATLIYFYGSGGSLWNSVRHLHELAQTLEVDVVAFDIRGNGSSGGHPNSARLRADALRIFDTQRRAGQPTLVMGYSFGSASAMHLAAQRPVDGLAVVAGLSSFDDVMPAVHALVPWYAKPFVRLDIDQDLARQVQPIEDIARVKAPTFLIHGEADTQLPVHCGDHLAARSGASWKRYLRVPGGGHTGLPLLSGDGLAGMQAWLGAVTAGTEAAHP